MTARFVSPGGAVTVTVLNAPPEAAPANTAFVYYHEAAPHWRSTPPLPGHRLSLKETRRLARTVGGQVVRFTSRAERLGRLVEAAQGVLEAGGGRAGRYELREALRPFLCGSRPNPGIGAGKVPCHDDDGETVCPCVRVKGHAPPCRCEHGTDY